MDNHSQNPKRTCVADLLHPIIIKTPLERHNEEFREVTGITCMGQKREYQEWKKIYTRLIIPVKPRNTGYNATVKTYH